MLFSISERGQQRLLRCNSQIVTELSTIVLSWSAQCQQLVKQVRDWYLWIPLLLRANLLKQQGTYLMNLNLLNS